MPRRRAALEIMSPQEFCGRLTFAPVHVDDAACVTTRSTDKEI
jgi:hypothetical protein